MRSCLRLASPLLLAWLSACASTPELPREIEVRAGRRTRIELVDLRRNLSLVLQNASSGSAEAVYSDELGSLATKVVADADLQKLLDVLAQQGMFASATATPAPDASAAIVVDQDGRRWVWSRPAATLENVAAIQTFEEGRGYVLTVYNAATAYHALDDRELRTMRAEIEKAEARQRDGLRSKEPR